MRPSVMEVSLENFKYNVRSVKSKISAGTKIMPIVKANAYGTFMNTQTDILNEFDIVGVALVDEGVQLRERGFKKEIFVLNQSYVEEIDDIIKNNLTISISNLDFVEKIGENGKNIKVHLEIETGMSRTGIAPKDIDKAIELIGKYKNIEIEGMYTHMSSAGIDHEYTKKQISIFNDAIEKVKSKVPNLKYIHMSASNGILNFPEANYNLVRPGMLLYGYESTAGALDKIDIKPICKLRSKITFLKTVDSGTSIGYMRSFITRRETKVATVPIGYADGVKRCLSNVGEVVINGVKAPIIGKICMDNLMVDVTDVPNVKCEDDVWIWDNEILTVYDVAKKANTTDYETIASITNRIPRIFK